MTATTTDVDTIRPAMAAEIQKILSRYLPRQSERFTWAQDQEISGTLRTFDCVFEASEDSPLAWHGGGIAMMSRCEILVSYPVSEPDLQRFMGADYQDLAVILVGLHTVIPGMFPVSMAQDKPIYDKFFNGQSGAYVGSFIADVHYYAIDTVMRQAI